MLSWGVSPQQVVTGKPNWGVEKDGGIGAGTECSLASFRASECGGDDDNDEDEEDEIWALVAGKEEGGWI